MSEPLVHLIDDDEAVRAALSFVLEMNDLPARTYPSAEAFLAIADGLLDFTQQFRIADQLVGEITAVIENVEGAGAKLRIVIEHVQILR